MLALRQWVYEWDEISWSRLQIPACACVVVLLAWMNLGADREPAIPTTLLPIFKNRRHAPSPGFKMGFVHVYIVYTIYNNPLHRRDTHKFLPVPTNPSSGSVRHYPLLDPSAGSRKHFLTVPTIHTIDPFSGSNTTLPVLSLYPPFFRINVNLLTLTSG